MTKWDCISAKNDCVLDKNVAGIVAMRVRFWLLEPCVEDDEDDDDDDDDELGMRTGMNSCETAELDPDEPGDAAEGWGFCTSRSHLFDGAVALAKSWV